MKEIRKKTAGSRSTVQCVQVRISKRYVSKIHDNMMWTLSVYSLENQPVKKDRVVHDSEVFHFMAYDWSRTIKQLLQDQQIPYSIAGYFSLDNIFSTNNDQISAADNEVKLMKPLRAMAVPGATAVSSLLLNSIQ